MNKQSFITIMLTVLMSITGAKTFAHDIEVPNANGETIYYVWVNNHTELAVSFNGSNYNDFNEYIGNIVIPESVVFDGNTYPVTSIDDEAFWGCIYLTSITIPQSITSIGNNAFMECTSLTSITIPNSVESIGTEAFSYCSGLASITIPNSVTSIGGFAFCGCSDLASVTIPNSVTSIGGYAFEATTWYDNQPDGLIYAGKVAYKYKGTMPNNTTIKIQDGTTGISGNAFSGCTGLSSITIPNSVKSIGGYAFEGTTWYDNQPDGLVYAGNVAYKYKGTIPDNTNIIIRDGTTEISDEAFICCTGLTSITIPNSVKAIGRWTFYQCSGLTSVTIPNGVNSIGQSAFANCSGLTSVTIPNSVKIIGDNAFSSCKLNSLTIQCEPTAFGKGVFSENYDITNVSYDCKTATSSYFDNLSGITTVYLSDKVTAIDNNFLSSTGLTTITFPDNLTTIGNGAFSNCIGLTSIIIPDKVTTIGNKAFSDCTRLNSLTIGAGVTSIGDESFTGCAVISITIPDNVKTIGIGAFSSCTKLTSLTIGSGVTSIGWYAFGNCTGLTSITIPDNVTTIGNGVFSSCTGLTSITLGYNLNSIGDYAFANCSSLKDLNCFAPVPPTFTSWDDSFNNVTLYVPYSSIDYYKEEWGNMGFSSILPIAGQGNPKLATPTITIAYGVLTFDCGTDGAEYHYSITYPESKNNTIGNNVQMPSSCTISVYATKAGFDKSDTATKEIKNGDLNGDGNIDVSDHVELTKIIMEQ